MEEKEIKHFWKYLDHYAEKKILNGVKGKLFGYEVSIQVLQDALNGRPIKQS